MPALLRTTQIQEPSSASVNLTLDTSGNGTFAGTVVMSSPYTMRNKIINGAMVIDQRNAGAAVTINSAAHTYVMDRWRGFGQATDGVFTVQQSSTAPSGFANSALITVTTADSSIGSSQIYTFAQSVEGLNIADLAWGTASAQTVTLSFQVRSSVTGSFSGSIKNSDGTRSYPFSYTINSANTYETKSITITGDTSGTWLTTNGIGLSIIFNLGSGSSRLGAAGAWASANYDGVTGSVSLISTLSATFYITGVQLERGTVATPFEYRNYQQELAMCQRYYSKSYDIGTVPATNTVIGLVQTMNGQDGNQICGPRWKQTMRVAPSVSIWSKTGTAASISTTSYADAANAGSWVGYDVGDDGMRIVVGTGGLTAASAYNFHYVASAEL